MRVINIPGVGDVKIVKSRLAKRIILKINSSGDPVVTLPQLTPYVIGKRFAIENSAWLQKHTTKQKPSIIPNGAKIGSEHTLRYKLSENGKLYSRVRDSVITISYGKNLSFDDSKVQLEAQKASIRALKIEAESILPELINIIADQNGYKYNSVSIKKMHSRWGSCSSKGDISLSIWLMQLPDDLVNYVLCHELAHLKHHNHQSSFWEEVENMVPNYKLLRKQLKNYTPKLMLA